MEPLSKQRTPSENTSSTNDLEAKEKQKLVDKHLRKAKACLKRLQANSENLKELLTPEELGEFVAGLTMWDKFINSKINK